MPHQGATAAGTAAYAKRFDGKAAAGHFRPSLGLTLSSIGLGTYLGRADDATDRAYVEAIEAAVRGGFNVLDSAINYRLERSERAIGQALAALASTGFGREEIVVATKGGYLPARDPEAYFREQILGPELATAEDLVAGCHCIAPGYLRHQLARSLENLGLQTIDVYYLHNPEQQLEEVEPDAFFAKMRAAFEALEGEVASGRIGFYGTATWNGYRVAPDAAGALSLEALVATAREVAGDAHLFRVVQLPFNLGMSDALVRETQTLKGEALPLLAVAQRLGVTVMTSASILQGRLTRGLPAAMQDALPGLANDAQRAIQFVRSAPGVTTALVGMAQAAHVDQNLGLLGVPPLPSASIAAFFAEA
jgi:aryl-alcohol dehydrogenase-like predicted oxidoreductase